MIHQKISFYIFIILIFLKYIRYERIFILSLNQNAQRLGIDLESHFYYNDKLADKFSNQTF